MNRKHHSNRLMPNFDPYNDYHAYILSQAWHVYAGNNVTYSPFQEHIAKALRETLGNDISKEVFLAAGKKHWTTLLNCRKKGGIMGKNFVDSDIHGKVVRLLSDTNDQIEWVENLPVSSQENEEDCTKWLEHLERVKIALAELVNQVHSGTVGMMADKE